MKSYLFTITVNYICLFSHYDYLIDQEIGKHSANIDDSFELMNDFLERFEQNEFYEKALLSGQFNIDFAYFRKLPVFQSYNLINDSDYHEYFSFSQIEVFSTSHMRHVSKAKEPKESKA